VGYPRLVYVLEQILLQGKDQIARDYAELEQLQSGRNLPERYAAKLPEIVNKKILDKANFMMSRSGIILNGEVIKENPKGEYLVLTILPETKNTLRALPFLTCSAFSGKLSENLEIESIEAAAVLNPITNQFYWSDTEKNARENFKKISTSKVENKDIANSISLNSSNLEICWLASAKIDILETNFDNFLNIAAAEFIAKKAGAISFVDLNEKTIKMVANQELANA